MPLVQTVPPALEPVTVADVRLQSNIIDAAQDSIISIYIAAARRFAESYCGRSFITQQWKLVLDSFPGLQMSGFVNYGSPYSLPPNGIQLDRGTVQSIESITYTAMDGTTQTMPTSEFAAELSGCPGRITPAFGKVWPIALPQIGAVRIAYTAGYGPLAADVPEGIRHWMLMRIATMYENRESVILFRGTVQALPFVDSLLDPYRVETA